MSNETRKVSPKKIKLGLRHLGWAAIVAGIVLVVAALIWLNSDTNSQPRALIGGQHFRLLVSDSDEERIQGLSGKRTIAQNEAMLFVFSIDDAQCIWMKDMNFSIDIVWLDARREVIAIAEKVSPATYPNQFCSPRPARYVVEMRAGMSSSVGLRTGDELRLAY